MVWPVSILISALHMILQWFSMTCLIIPATSLSSFTKKFKTYIFAKACPSWFFQFLSVSCSGDDHRYIFAQLIMDLYFLAWHALKSLFKREVKHYKSKIPIIIM